MSKLDRKYESQHSSDFSNRGMIVEPNLPNDETAFLFGVSLTIKMDKNSIPSLSLR